MGARMATVDDMEWIENPEGAGEDDVRRVEKELGVEFPEDFRAFALRFSGGSPASHTDFDFADEGRYGTFNGGVGTFLSMRKGASMALLAEAEALAGRLAKGLVPFAAGPGGDYLCFDYRGSAAAPGVVYWHHGREGLEDQYSLVARSFTELLSLLYEPDIDAEEALD
jgi:cell wall assembly regulator SMI1